MQIMQDFLRIAFIIFFCKKMLIRVLKKYSLGANSNHVKHVTVSLSMGLCSALK